MEANLTVNILFIFSLIYTMFFSFENINLNIEPNLNKVNNKIITLTIFMLILEICYLLVPVTSDNFFIIIHHILRITTLLLLPIFPMIGIIIVKSSLGLKYNFTNLILPNIINIALCILNLKFKFIYIINSNNIYSRSYLFILSISISYIYISYLLVFLIKYKNKFSMKKFLYFLFYTLFLTITSLLQLLFNDLHFFWAIYATSIIINYILIQEKVLYYNNITLNKNRFALIKTVSDLTSKGDNFLLLFIKIENLNSITKNFGPKEKYKYILYAYNLLKNSFKHKGELFHCKDDCFIILTKYNPSTNIDKIINNINIFLNKNTKYTLIYNFHYDIFNNNYANIFDYLHHIDTIIYNFPCNNIDN